jgi:hypothetical protein
MRQPLCIKMRGAGDGSSHPPRDVIVRAALRTARIQVASGVLSAVSRCFGIINA